MVGRHSLDTSPADLRLWTWACHLELCAATRRYSLPWRGGEWPDPDPSPSMPCSQLTFWAGLAPSLLGPLPALPL